MPPNEVDNRNGERVKVVMHEMLESIRGEEGRSGSAGEETVREAVQAGHPPRKRKSFLQVLSAIFKKII